MTGGRQRSSAAIGALLVGLAVGPIASAQYTGAPFFEWTVLQSQAFGLEMVAQRLRIVEALEPPLDTELGEIVEMMIGPDFERFGATLAGRDEALAAQLHETLKEIVEAVEEGEGVGKLLPVARQLLTQAYDLVVSPTIQHLAAFKGGVMAQLLLAEGGVAEGLEEAFLEQWEFANGWAATQRVKVLWQDIDELASDQRRADVEEMLALIDSIYPTPEPPETFAGIDPEEAEVPAQRIVGILEEVVDAELYSGRDLLRLVSYLVELARPACQSYEAGEDELGREVIYAVFDHYGEMTGLGALIGLFAPDVNETVMAAFEGLVAVEDDDDGDGEDGAGMGGAGNADDGDDEMTGAKACNQLVEGLEAARSILGG